MTSINLSFKSILRRAMMGIGVAVISMVFSKAQAIETQAAKSTLFFKDCVACPEMVVIPAGSFLMGSPSAAEVDSASHAKSYDAHSSEQPQHLVQIKSFSIGKYEVTQAEWLALMDNNLSLNSGSKLPVENVTWDDAQEFVKKLSLKTGKKYRLPSEAEWEYAARAGTATAYSWGNSDSVIHAYAWISPNATNTNLVGTKKPNNFGLFDMAGNVWEWTEDCWNENYVNAPNDGRAWTTGNCAQRILRGGSWFNGPQLLRPSFRARNTSAIPIHTYYGFRVAMSQ